MELKKTFGDTKSDNKQSESVITRENKIEQSNDNVENKKNTDNPNEKDLDSTLSLSLSTVIKMLSGSCDCKTCCLSNLSNVHQCEACKEETPGISGESRTEFNKFNESKMNTTEVTSSIIETNTEKPNLSSIFKPSPGSWECKSCYVYNTPDHNSCAACGGIRPGSSIETSANTNSVKQFQFGMPPQSATDSLKFFFGSNNTSTYNFPSSSTYSFNASGAKSSNDSSVSAFSQKPTDYSFTSTQSLKSG